MSTQAQIFLEKVRDITEPPSHIPSKAFVVEEESAMDIGDIGDYAYAEELAEYNRKKNDPNFIDLDEELEYDEDSMFDALNGLADAMSDDIDFEDDEEVDRLINDEEYAEIATKHLDVEKKEPSNDERYNPQSTLNDMITRSIENFKLTKKGEVDEKVGGTEYIEKTPEDTWQEDEDAQIEMSGSLTQDYIQLQEDIFGTYGDNTQAKLERIIKIVDASTDEPLIACWNPVKRVLVTQSEDEYQADENSIAIYVNSAYGTETIAEEDYELIEVDGFTIVEEAVTPIKKSVKKIKPKAKKKAFATISQLINKKRKASFRFKRMSGKLRSRRKSTMHRTDMKTLRNRAWKEFTKKWHSNLAMKFFRTADVNSLSLIKKVQLDQKVKKMLPRLKRKFNIFLQAYIKKVRSKSAPKASK